MLFMLELFGRPSEINLCGHNIKEFDVPYICRRLLVNGLPIPGILDVASKKPWEVPFLDTLEMWKFGDYKNFTSLNLLTAIFNIPTPKDDINGSQVAQVYYEERDVERISVYCQKDVVATAQLWLRLNGCPLIAEEYIEHDVILFHHNLKNGIVSERGNPVLLFKRAEKRSGGI